MPSYSSEVRNILSRALYKMHVVDHTFIDGRLAGARHHFSGEIAQRHLMAQLRHFNGRLPFAAAGIQHPQRSRPQLRQQRFQIGELNATIEDSLLGQRVVKAFAAEEEENKKFDIPDCFGRFF